MAGTGLSPNQPHDQNTCGCNRQPGHPDKFRFRLQNRLDRPFHLFREQSIDCALEHKGEPEGGNQIDHNRETYSAGTATLLWPK